MITAVKNPHRQKGIFCIIIISPYIIMSHIDTAVPGNCISCKLCYVLINSPINAFFHLLMHKIISFGQITGKICRLKIFLTQHNYTAPSYPWLHLPSFQKHLPESFEISLNIPVYIKMVMIMYTLYFPRLIVSYFSASAIILSSAL